MLDTISNADSIIWATLRGLLCYRIRVSHWINKTFKMNSFFALLDGSGGISSGSQWVNDDYPGPYCVNKFGLYDEVKCVTTKVFRFYIFCEIRADVHETHVSGVRALLHANPSSLDTKFSVQRNDGYC